MALVTTSYGIRPDTRNLLKICFLCFRESRPIVQAMCLLRFATGVILGATVGGPPDSPRALGGALAWVAAAFTIYLYNGVSDITEDRRNGSNRPVARGDLSLRDAMVGTAVASIVSLSVAVWCGGLLALLVLALLAAGYAYSSPPFLWKQHIAGVFFTGTAITFLSLYAGYTCFAGTMVADRQTVIMIVMFSLWTGLVGQTKDLPDLEGDSLAGRRNLPCVLGEPRARLVLAVTALVLAAASIAFTLSIAPGLLLSTVVTVVGAVWVALALADRRGGRSRSGVPYQIFMVTQFAMYTSALVTTGLTLAG